MIRLSVHKILDTTRYNCSITQIQFSFCIICFFLSFRIQSNSDAILTLNLELIYFILMDFIEENNPNERNKQDRFVKIFDQYMKNNNNDNNKFFN